MRASATADLMLQSPYSGWSEQDPAAWWDATCAALAEIGRATPLSQFKAIGLSGQMHVPLSSTRFSEAAFPWNLPMSITFPGPTALDFFADYLEIPTLAVQVTVS